MTDKPVLQFKNVSITVIAVALIACFAQSIRARTAPDTQTPNPADCNPTTPPAAVYGAKPKEAGCTRSGLHYAIYGEGTPILLIHGLGASMYSWREIVRANDQFPGYQLILVDLKGAGDSAKPRDNNYSILTQRDLVYDFIQERDLHNLTLIGNSYGGAVCLLLALKMVDEHDRLAKMILIDSGGYNLRLPKHLKILREPIVGPLAVHLLSPKYQASFVLHEAYSDTRKITDEQVAEYARPIGSRNGRYALLKTGQQALPENINEITAQYSRIKAPTLIIWGLDDRVIPVQIGELLHAAIGGSRMELINDAGHVPQEERPAETICWIREFLGLPFKPCPK